MKKKTLTRTLSTSNVFRQTAQSGNWNGFILFAPFIIRFSSINSNGFSRSQLFNLNTWIFQSIIFKHSFAFYWKQTCWVPKVHPTIFFFFRVEISPDKTSEIFSSFGNDGFDKPEIFFYFPLESYKFWLIINIFHIFRNDSKKKKNQILWVSTWETSLVESCFDRQKGPRPK